MKKIWIAGAAILVVGAAYYGLTKSDAVAQPTEVVIPELSELATAGEVAFNGTCASCHGINLAGTDKGPPFLHSVYVKNHHSDMAFILAVKQGARAHHWRFGNMPAQENITDDELAAIITYVREVQAANGF